MRLTVDDISYGIFLLLMIPIIMAISLLEAVVVAIDKVMSHE